MVLLTTKAQAEDIFNIVQLSWIVPDAAEGGSRAAADEQAQVPPKGPAKCPAARKRALLPRLMQSKRALIRAKER